MNRLGAETSLYLRQHAGNPVHWQPWGEAAWEEARRKDRLVVVSIGYAACHWCHVMERETFEDEGAADVMNAHFVCIKVDREERPDVDQVYMAAVTLMTRQGGWPLHAVCMPDGRPIYGGMYFPRDQWVEVLQSLVGIWKGDRGRVEEYAQRLAAGVALQGELEVPGSAGAGEGPEGALGEQAVARWRKDWDGRWGGERRAPKFPTAGAWDFLLGFGLQMQDESALEQVRQTLLCMERGAIHDHVGGGFARYSVDAMWRVPHFEKMLCDQGLLLGLYARAWRWTPEPAFARAVAGMVRFLEAELGGEDGAFRSALDADSEGAEGRYYVWTEAQWTEALPDPELRAWAEAVYEWHDRGVWEESVPGARVVMRWAEDAVSALALGMEEEAWQGMRVQVEAALGAYRQAHRLRPALDDKVLTAWNALAIEGLAQAGAIFGRADWVGRAERAADFLLREMRAPDGRFFRAYHPRSGPRIPGFLDDQAYAAAAFLQLYQVTFAPRWYAAACEAVSVALRDFRHPVTGQIHFNTSSAGTFVQLQDADDSAVPSALAALARALFLLGMLEDRPEWSDLSRGLLAGALARNATLPSGAHWLGLLGWQVHPFVCWGLVGGSAAERASARAHWHRHHLGQGFLFGEPDAPASPAGPTSPAGPAWLPRLLDAAPDPSGLRPLRWHPCRPGACGLPQDHWTPQ